MSRGWKNGEAALLTFKDGSTALGVREARFGRWLHSGTFGGGAAYDRIGGFETRPIVAIDPENREQVERLFKAFDDEVEGASGFASDLQAALRSLIADPKPEEPQGLGAVVENDQGRHFIRQHDGWWRGDEPCILNWAAVHAVRVLSEGWSE